MAVTTVPSFETKVTPSSMSNADIMTALHDHYNASSAWTVELAESAGADAFAIYKATGKTYQILFRVNGGAIKMSLDPDGAVTTVSTLANASANISPELTFTQATSNADTFLIQEWADYTRIFQRTNVTTPPSYVEMFEGGDGIYGLLGSDDGNDFDGLYLAAGSCNIGSSVASHILSTSVSATTSYARTATSTWQKVKSSDSLTPSGLTDIDHLAVGGRVEPYPMILRLNAGTGLSQREVAVHKYWFGYTGGSRFSGDIYDDATNSRQMMIVGDGTLASYRWMTPVIDGFDPTA